MESRPGEVGRGVLLGAAGSLASGPAAAQAAPTAARPQNAAPPGPGGLLRPQRNRFRNVLDLSGLWRFQLDPQEKGEAQGWARALPAPRFIPVPCSWNELFDDARDYLGLAWYQTEVWSPSAWRGQRVFLRAGSANYAAKVWVNGALAAEHGGGHLPFAADITERLAWDQPNVVAVSVKNKQLLERVPPGPGPGGGGVAGVLDGYPATTYDFFPYAGLHRQVWLYSVPADARTDDITVATATEDNDGVITLKAAASGGYSGKGRVRLNGAYADLDFRASAAEATVRVRWAEQ